MKRWCLALGLVVGLATMGGARSADVEHKRGDFTFHVGDVPAFVQVHEIPANWDPKAPGNDEAVWRYWLYDEQIDRRAGKVVAYTDYAYEARTATNLTEAGKYTIEFNPEYQVLTLHAVAVRRNGAWQDRLQADKISLARRETDFEKDMSDGRVTAMIVLDDVRVGDVVRVRYTIAGSNPILADQYFDSVATAWRSPLLDVHERVLFDAGTAVNSHQRNNAPAPKIARQADATEVRLDVHGAKAVIDEGDYPNWYDPWPSVQFGKARQWSDVVAWALPLYPTDDALPADLQARVDAWRKLPDPNARLREALRVVQDEVRYFGVEMGSSTHRPAPPSTTWTRRYGDCKDKTYLLATILRKLDIAATPALVATTSGRGLLNVEPTAAAFDHVIVRAKIGDAVVYVDPTNTQQGGDPADLDLSGYGTVLPIAPGVVALEAIAAPAKSNDAVTVKERYVPQADGKQVRYEIAMTFQGAHADDVRRAYAGQRTDDVERRYTDYYRKRYGELSVASPMVVQDDRNTNTLVVKETYLLAAPFDTENGVRGIDVFGMALEDPTDTPRTLVRTGPLALGTPSRYRHEVAFAVPKGWRPTFNDIDEKIDTPAYAFAMKLDRNDIDGKDIALSYTLDAKAHELDPASANKHIAQLREMRDLLSSRLRFEQPPERIGSKERDDRLKNLLRDVMDEGKTQ